MTGGNDLEKRIKGVAIFNSINSFLSASNWNIICCGFWMMMEATNILESCVLFRLIGFPTDKSHSFLLCSCIYLVFIKTTWHIGKSSGDGIEYTKSVSLKKDTPSLISSKLRWNRGSSVELLSKVELVRAGGVKYLTRKTLTATAAIMKIISPPST